MHFCEATIALASDITQLVIRDKFDPISWPEIEVLRHIHGEGAVSDVKPFIDVVQSPKDEKIRLAKIYTTGALDKVFPGIHPQMEMKAPRAKVPAEDSAEGQDIKWRNPLDLDPFAGPAVADQAPEF